MDCLVSIFTDHLDETCFTVPAKRITLADEMQVSKALHINYHLSAVHQDMGNKEF